MVNVGKYTVRPMDPVGVVKFPRKVHQSRIHTWRIIPVSKWLITMVIVSPLNGDIPLTNGRFMACK